jgi:cytochrome c biogenesis protein CcmG, thiol:disulfide interchange protein DsbE
MIGTRRVPAGGGRAGVGRRPPAGPATALVLLLAVVACAPGDAGTARPAAKDDDGFRPLAVGDTVPAYAAATVGGAAGDSVRVAGGAQPLTLVNVWATWCTACREEFGDLERLHREYGARGVRVVAVSVDDGSDEKVARFARAEKVTFTVAHDAAGRVQRLYQTVGVPETYLVSPDGKLLWRRAGALSHGAPEARAALDAALGGGG